AVAVAERLRERAEPGQVLVSELVRTLIADAPDTRLNDLGLIRVDGVADPLRAFELEWRRAFAGVEDPTAGGSDAAHAVASEPPPPPRAPVRPAAPTEGAGGLPSGLAGARARELVGRGPELE